ncbi:hypothetical protein BU16DRAFT_522802 [Lophium mytilinum]|uniref:F-box domain-containing protein n=1 Tax=Lophium mytilinum TaxID=390894 RepID=A0A6A6RB40_9PEZI|nr:hypothetical protein BU16DRAFT_522802 [Lophium mytilinum]
MPGIAISHKSVAESDINNDYIFIGIWPRDARNIYDVIAQFENLHTLYLFVKDWWQSSSILGSEKAVARNLQKLTNLKLGGQIHQDMLLALLARPENIQHLSLINLIQSPGQEDGPDPVLFLRSIQKRFTNLKSLHMSKLAELTEDHDISGARWEFDLAGEIELLREWADFLRHVSGTLRELTLENRYHVSTQVFDFTDEIDPGSAEHPAHYGRRSNERCWEVLLPVFSERTFPKLKKLNFIGMSLFQSPEALAHLSQLGSHVDIEDKLGGIIKVTDESTPQNFSPPNGLFQD